MLMWRFFSWQVSGKDHMGHLDCDGTKKKYSVQEMPPELRYGFEKNLTGGEEPVTQWNPPLHLRSYGQCLKSVKFPAVKELLPKYVESPLSVCNSVRLSCSLTVLVFIAESLLLPISSCDRHDCNISG